MVDVSFGGFKVLAPRCLGPRGGFLHLRRVAADFRRHMSSAYTTGIMVKVAWSKPSSQDSRLYEAGLTLAEVPGSMTLGWYRELLTELGLDEATIFSRRSHRRFRCRLPAVLSFEGGEAPREISGTLLDLSSGGALLATPQTARIGCEVILSATWGAETLVAPGKVVGVRKSEEVGSPEELWWHSLTFDEGLEPNAGHLLSKWLGEFSRND